MRPQAFVETPRRLDPSSREGLDLIVDLCLSIFAIGFELVQALENVALGQREPCGMKRFVR